MDKLSSLLTPVDIFHGDRNNDLEVRFDRVTAGYEPDKPVLSELSFKLCKGERVAVVGESGSGKTTLLNLLCGYLRPESGTVQSPWPVATVPQIPFLFNDTIYNNVALGNPDISAEQVTAACKEAGVLNFTDKLSDGLSSRVGINGTGLSAGERQRVCLARALASGRGLLLLDEVTASLDGGNEDSIIDTLARLKNRTIIAVTHRARTAAFTDRTLVLAEGKVVAEGKFADLCKRSNVVRHLFRVETD